MIMASPAQAGWLQDLEAAKQEVESAGADIEAGKALQDAEEYTAACAKYLSAAGKYAGAVVTLMEADVPAKDQAAVNAIISQMQTQILSLLDLAIACCEQRDKGACLPEDDYTTIMQATGDVTQGLDDLIAGSIPTVSEWGLIALTVLLLTAGGIVIVRRRRAAA
jgi:hypothetical protein